MESASSASYAAVGWPPVRTTAHSSAARSSAVYVIGSNSSPIRIASSRRRPAILPDRFATQFIVGDRRHDHPHLRRQKVTNPLLACQGFRRPLGIRENPERSGIEEDEPHEPNRGRSDNRSSLTARARYANVSRCSSSSPMSSSESRACNARAARRSISSGVRGNARPLASNERGGDVNTNAAGMAKTPSAVTPCFDGATAHYSLDSTPERVENRAWWVR